VTKTLLRISSSSVVQKAREVFAWSRLHLQSLASHWAFVVGYGPLSISVIHEEGLYPSSVDINRLMLLLNCCYVGMSFNIVRQVSSSSFSYPYPTKCSPYNMFSSCCDKDSAYIFSTGRLPDVNIVRQIYKVNIVLNSIFFTIKKRRDAILFFCLAQHAK
jgi:hypothetical protein